MPRFPPRGPLGRLFPASSVLSRHCDFLPPISPRFVSFVWRYHGITHVSLPPSLRATKSGLGLMTRYPVRASSVETTGAPKFLGNPHSRLRMFFDPGRSRRPRPIAERSHGPRGLNDEGTDDKTPFEAR